MDGELTIFVVVCAVIKSSFLLPHILYTYYIYIKYIFLYLIFIYWSFLIVFTYDTATVSSVPPPEVFCSNSTR